MRQKTVSLLTMGIALAALGACSDSIASRIAAPDNAGDAKLAPSAASLNKSGDNGNQQSGGDNGNQQSGNDDGDHQVGNNDGQDGESDKYRKDHDDDRVTVCHLTGRPGSGKYTEMSMTRHASYSHIDDHGTPKAGHEEDYYEDDHDRGCQGGSGVTKTLTSVKTMKNGKMVDDNWSAGQPVIIPKGETRWLFYTITYSMPKEGKATLWENRDAVCGTLGKGYTCKFPGNVSSWDVKGSNMKTVQIDLTNDSECSEKTFVNTITLTPKKGTAHSASSSVVVRGTCGVTLTKVLDHVMTEVLDASGTQVGMAPDGSYTGGAVTIPMGQTRWLFYKVAYTLPTGVTGTLTDDATTACATLGGGNLECVFADLGKANGVETWQVSGEGFKMVQVDISDNGYNSVCGDRTFTNVVVLKASNGQTYTATSTKTIHFDCTPRVTKVLDHVMTEVLDANGVQVGMAPDLTYTGGAVTIPAGQTRWLFYRIDYAVPPGATANLLDNATTACATLGGGNLQCVFADLGKANGVESWQVSGIGSKMVQVDISNNGYNGICGDRTFTNTANLGTLSAAATTLIHFVCK